MVVAVSIAMVVLIVGLGIRGFNDGSYEATRHLRVLASQPSVSPEARDLMRKAGYDI